nr:MAG TPA: hypothetical protein [Bacteriophage sp.]
MIYITIISLLYMTHKIFLEHLRLTFRFSL